MNRFDFTITYDADDDRLVYTGKSADEEYWNSNWKKRISLESIKLGDRFVTSQTLNSLQKGSKVLDAGCGLGQTVWGLSQAGFNAYGIDYAISTVDLVNNLAPDLNISVGDVFDLPFESNTFDGVWSLGVIEHFPSGYAKIVQEMWRVLKPGGKAFVTVPVVSPYRRWCINNDKFPRFNGEYDDFFQFAFPTYQVKDNFTKSDEWIFEHGKYLGGLTGLIDGNGHTMVNVLSKIVQSDSGTVRYVRGALNLCLANVSGHTYFYEFTKK